MWIETQVSLRHNGGHQIFNNHLNGVVLIGARIVGQAEVQTPATQQQATQHQYGQTPQGVFARLVYKFLQPVHLYQYTEFVSFI